MLAQMLWLSAVATPAPFTLVPDCCPNSLDGYVQYKGTKFDSLKVCEAACSAAECAAFTWNHEVKPHQCWGYTRKAQLKFGCRHTSHCTSGCVAAKVKDCDAHPPSPSPPPPGPPPPLPPGFVLPHWVGPRPKVETNASAGLRMVPNAQHILVYNATAADGKPNAFGAVRSAAYSCNFFLFFWLTVLSCCCRPS